MLTTHTWGPHTVLGTTWYITLPQDCSDAASAVAAAWAWLDTFDAHYSRFRPDSFVGQLNATGTLDDPPEELNWLLQKGIALFQASAGRLNFLTGHLQAARGYNQQIDRLEHDTDTTQLPDPMTDLQFNTHRVTLQAGAVDLGSFGKGYAIDQLTILLRVRTGSPFILVNGGGDLYLHNPEQYDYPLYLSHPWQPDRFTHRLDHYHGSVANSNASLRRWQTKNTNRTYSHLIDLADPARDPDSLAAATVCAPKALDADAYATLLTLLPQQQHERLLPYPYLRIFADGSSRHTADFPGQALQ